MVWLRKAYRRLRLLFFWKHVEAEMEEEFAFHFRLEVEANLRAGMPPREARRQALLTFGGMDRFKERARDARGPPEPGRRGRWR